MKFDQITGGCSATAYCPDDPVTRGQMAIFLMRGEFNQLTSLLQPLLVSGSPTTARIGQTTTILLTGSNTHFVQGTTVVKGGPGVVVGTVTVSSPTTLTAVVTIDLSVTPGQRTTLLAVTGVEEAVLPNGVILQ